MRTLATPAVRTFLNRVVNPVVKLLLRSPLHSLLSHRIMLVTVTGRRTARRLTFPIGYRRRPGAMIVVTARDRSWWRNLEGGSRAVLRIQGRDIEATGDAQLPPDEAAVALELRALYRVSTKRAARMAGRRLLVCFRPVGYEMENGS
jgi:F420H(2)-dependent quinone reductase